MPKWTKRDLRMDEDHGWRCKPGYTIFVADRGAVRFDVPESWVVQVDAAGVKIHDKPPPDDNARIQLSIFFPPPVVEWGELPLATMLADALAVRRLRDALPRLGQRKQTIVLIGPVVDLPLELEREVVRGREPVHAGPDQDVRRRVEVRHARSRSSVAGGALPAFERRRVPVGPHGA